MTGENKNPSDPRRAQQSVHTGGDLDTGEPALEHQSPRLPTEEEKAIGRAAIKTIRAQRGWERPNR